MVNFRIISKIIGQLLFLESALMLVCLAMSRCYGEDDSMAFAVATLLTVGGGLLCMYYGRGSDNSLTRRDAYVVVALTWVVFSLFGMLPFLVGGYVRGVADAYFETMSGFTTTGATVIDDVERLPHAILFWRSLTQWIGGLGIVFFTVAVLPSLVGGSVKVFAAEATGPVKSKMHPRLSTNAKWLWSVYTALTVACVLAFYAAGMDWFDSVNYSMTTTATGGFTTHNDSAAFFHSRGVEYVAIAFQFLSGVNFTLLYVVMFKRRFAELLRNTEFRLYASVVALATAFVASLLSVQCGYGLERALRCALFQVVSFITTTGLFNDDAAQWPRVTWMVLALLMFVGACAGSTSGGFKCMRASMLLKMVGNEFRRILHPNAVLPVKVNGQSVPQQKLTSLTAFLAIFAGMCLLSAMAMVMVGIDGTNAVAIALGCLGNAGPTLGTEMGPPISWGGLPVGVKWLCSALMLVGRLEVMSVLVLFTRGFWKDV